MDQEKLALLTSLWESGLVSARIGERLGVSGAHVRMVACELGLTRRLATDRRPKLCRELGLNSIHQVPGYYNWVHLRKRVERPKEKDFRYAEVKVAPRWDKFESFYADMGPRPTDLHTVDRINPYGDYAPENCRWATPLQQANNRKNSFVVVYLDQPMTLTEAIRRSGSKINKSTARSRILKGWSVVDALTKPAPGRWAGYSKKLRQRKETA